MPTPLHDEKCSVLIPSCDAYSDLWVPFLTLFWRHWPDCPYPVYLGSNMKSLEFRGVRALHAGHGNIWTDRVCEQLQQLNTEYVILFLEDFFLRRRVITNEINQAIDFLHSNNGHMLRLVPRPPPDHLVAGRAFIGELLPGAPYRVSTQVAIWRRSSLVDLMRAGESIWEFELLGSRRSDRLAGFYSTNRSLVPYGHHVVERGRWFPHEVLRYKWSRIGCDFKRRRPMGTLQYTHWLLRKSLSLLLEILPWKARGRLVGLVRRKIFRG